MLKNVISEKKLKEVGIAQILISINIYKWLRESISILTGKN